MGKSARRDVRKLRYVDPKAARQARRENNAEDKRKRGRKGEE